MRDGGGEERIKEGGGEEREINLNYETFKVFNCNC